MPLHELLHAAGCVVSGGTVQRLEIHPAFGGRLLAAVFPWVVARAEYAGRLAAFTPAGDLSYLVTVLLPHLVLAPLGAFVCRAATRRARPLLFGAGVLAAGQPLASLFGDFYEAAAIPMTRLARALGASWAFALRGDDLSVVGAAAAKLGTPAAWGLVAVGVSGGAVLAITLLYLSGGVAGRRSAPAPGAPPSARVLEEE